MPRILDEAVKVTYLPPQSIIVWDRGRTSNSSATPKSVCKGVNQEPYCDLERQAAHAKRLEASGTRNGARPARGQSKNVWSSLGVSIACQEQRRDVDPRLPNIGPPIPTDLLHA